MSQLQTVIFFSRKWIRYIMAYKIKDLEFFITPLNLLKFKLSVKDYTHFNRAILIRSTNHDPVHQWLHEGLSSSFVSESFWSFPLFFGNIIHIVWCLNYFILLNISLINLTKTLILKIIIEIRTKFIVRGTSRSKNKQMCSSS